MPTDNKLEKLTENAKVVLAKSYEVAVELGSVEVTPSHLFIAILKNSSSLAFKLLSSLGIDPEKTISSLTQRLKVNDLIGSKQILLSESMKRVITDAYYISHSLEHVYVGTEHFLLALLKQEEEDFVREFKIAGFDYNIMQDKLLNFGTYAPGVFMKSTEDDGINEKESSSLAFGRDLTEMAKEGKINPIFGRKKEVERLIHILARRSKNNPILIGEAGVGKTAIVELFCQKIIKGEVPEFLKGFHVIQIDIASIIAGSKVRGDVEERLLSIVEDVASSENKILFIDEIHMIVGAGTAGSGSLDVANTLKPYLTDNNVRIIGATTNSEYQKYFEEDSALVRRFQPLRVNEISKDATIKVLKGMRNYLEDYYNVVIDDEVIEDATKLSSRYIIDRYLPDKAIDVIDEAAASVKITGGKSVLEIDKERSKLDNLGEEKSDAIDKGDFEKALAIQEDEKKIKSTLNISGKKRPKKRKKVTTEHVKKVISEWAGVPITTISASDLRSLKGIGNRLAKRIIGQSEAVSRVASGLKRAKIGIGNEDRPLASFMLLGPTGVGKTEMARVIAEEIFGDEDALIQVDMSEYMEQHSVSKIIGSPPGYVGHSEGGQLTEKIRRKPYSIVLFDEIEKAHSELINILLQILDEGRVTDSKGREINFRNSIIAMTSNIGAKEIAQDKTLGFHIKNEPSQESEKKAYNKIRMQLIGELKKEMPPEFLNRLDDIIIFKALTIKDAEKIVKLLLDDLQKRLMEKGVVLDYDRTVLQFIAEKGFDQEYGARNLQRKIQEMIETNIADIFLDSSGKLQKVRVKKVKGKDALEFTTSKNHSQIVQVE